MLSTVTVLVLTLALPAATEVATRQAHSPAAPRVFVFTTESKAGPPTTEEQERLDSVRDVREALGKKAGLVMVSTADEATVLVEVVGREKRDAPIGGFGGTSVTPQGAMIVRLHLKAGEHETDVKGVAPGYWGRAAKDASDRAMKWIARIANLPAKGGKTQRSPESTPLDVRTIGTVR
jgi:hypothetical protein